MLDAEEETAVVYHEVHHLWHRDPLKTTLLSVFAIMMPYIPVLKHTSKHYNIVREILADNEAIERTGNVAGIGSALLKLLRACPEPWGAKELTVQSSFADTSVNCPNFTSAGPGKGRDAEVATLCCSDVGYRFPVAVYLVCLVHWIN